MKTKIVLIFLSFLFSIIFSPYFRAQIYSEAPITISDKNEILTDMLYIKFKRPNVIKFSKGESKTVLVQRKQEFRVV